MSWKNTILSIPDWPQKGILFRDITPLLANQGAFSACLQDLAACAEKFDFDSLVAIESRGFIFGSALANMLGKRLILARKPGKLPRACFAESYELEYGTSGLEIHQDDLGPDHRALIFDDVLATGGTAKAACDLVQKAGSVVAGCLFLIELDFLNGKNKLDYDVSSLIHY